MEIPKSGESIYKTITDSYDSSALYRVRPLPLTPNGKIDRKALPAPDEQVIEDLNVLPRTPSEELYCLGLGSSVRIENISIQDSFF